MIKIGGSEKQERDSSLSLWIPTGPYVFPFVPAFIHVQLSLLTPSLADL